MVGYVTNAFYLEAHWLFCWRYMVVAEELAAVTRSRQACSPRCLSLTNIFVTILIVLDGVLGMAYTGILSFQGTQVSYSFQIWSSVIFTILCIVLDVCMLLFAVVRVRAMLKKIAGISLNVVYMTLHVAVLVLLTLLWVIEGFSCVGGTWMVTH